MVTQARDGPGIETYVETRFNLLTVAVDKTERAVRERIDAVEREAARGLKHQREITHLLKEAADKSTFKADETQTRVNAATNEWKATVTSINSDKASLVTVTKLEADFAAYKLEKAQELSSYKLEVQSTVAAVVAKQISETGFKQGAHERDTESRASLGVIIGLAVGAATIASFVISLLHPVPAAPVAPQAQSQPFVPQGYMLVPSQQTQTPK